MRLGPESALLAAQVDLREGLDSEQLEAVCVRIKRDLRARFPLLEQVFLDITDADREDRRRAAGRRAELDETVAGLPARGRTS